MLDFAKDGRNLKRLWWALVCATAAAVVSVVSAVGTGVALAYNDIGGNVCKWSYDDDTTLELPYRSDPQFPSTGAYAVAWSSARLDWNDADTPAEFTYDGGQQSHTLGATEMGMSAANGVLYAYCWNFGKRSATRGLLNESRLESKNAVFKRSTASHELGHYIGLRHSTVTPSIMNYSGNFYSYGIQQQDDECGVQDLYSHEDYPLECDY